jgi:hypothetical protein
LGKRTTRSYTLFFFSFHFCNGWRQAKRGGVRVSFRRDASCVPDLRGATGFVQIVAPPGWRCLRIGCLVVEWRHAVRCRFRLEWLSGAGPLRRATRLPCPTSRPRGQGLCVLQVGYFHGWGQRLLRYRRPRVPARGRNAAVQARARLSRTRRVHPS